MADNKHIVVCGGGVIGVCTTYFLAKKSLFVTLVEQSSIACAASGKAGGFLALDMCDNGPVSALARASFNLHRLLSEELDGPRFYGYRPLTALCVSVTESEDVEGEADQSVTSWVDDPARMAHTIGEVYVCGMSAQTEVPDDPEQVVGDPESIAALTRIAKTVSSYLVEGEGATIKAEQACFLPCTDDSVPVIGEVPGVKGCYVATGHNCWGILNGPATGSAVAELVLDGAARIVDLSAFSPNRFVNGAHKKRI